MALDYKIYAVRKDKDNYSFAVEALNVIIESETPEDIFERGVFKDVENDYGCVFVADGSVVTSYSVQAGTDRKEEYYERNSKGELVERTRTVTDWQPVSGSHMFSGYGAVISAANPNRLKYSPDIVSDCEPYQDNLDFDTIEPFEVDEKIRKMALDSLKSQAEQDTSLDISNSYDHIKGLRCSSNVMVDYYEQYIIPTQQIKFEYNSQEYYLSSFARKGAEIIRELPTISDDIDKQVKNQMYYGITRPLVVNLIISIFYALWIWSSIKYEGYVSNVNLAVIILVIVIIFQILYSKIYKKKYNKNRMNIVNLLKEKKRKTVEKILSKYNY